MSHLWRPPSTQVRIVIFNDWTVGILLWVDNYAQRATFANNTGTHERSLHEIAEEIPVDARLLNPTINDIEAFKSERRTA